MQGCDAEGKNAVSDRQESQHFHREGWCGHPEDYPVVKEARESVESRIMVVKEYVNDE